MGEKEGVFIATLINEDSKFCSDYLSHLSSDLSSWILEDYSSKKKSKTNEVALPSIAKHNKSKTLENILECNIITQKPKALISNGVLIKQKISAESNKISTNPQKKIKVADLNRNLKIVQRFNEILNPKNTRPSMGSPRYSLQKNNKIYIINSNKSDIKFPNTEHALDKIFTYYKKHNTISKIKTPKSHYEKVFYNPNIEKNIKEHSMIIANNISKYSLSPKRTENFKIFWNNYSSKNYCSKSIISNQIEENMFKVKN